MNYNSVSNQWLITIKDANEPKKGAKETFITLNSENTYNAMRDLKSTTFQLWFYLCDNMKGFKLWLSRADVINKTGISASSYARAVAELKEKGYLVYTSNNHYDFYAIPYAPAKQTSAPAREFTLPSPASEEEDYKRADIQPPRPQARERKTLTTDAICSLLAEEC